MVCTHSCTHTNSQINGIFFPNHKKYVILWFLYLTLCLIKLLVIKWVEVSLLRKPIISSHPLRPVFNYQLFITPVLMIADGVFVSLLSLCLHVVVCGLITLFNESASGVCLSIWHSNLISSCVSTSICTQRNKYQPSKKMTLIINHHAK